MDQQHLFEPIPEEKLSLLTKEELVILLKGEQSLRRQLQKHYNEAIALNEELKQKKMLLEEQCITIKNKLFGKSSERSKKATSTKACSKDKKKKVHLPSERYPNTPVIERHVTLDELPHCDCCGAEMVDSGLVEESEYLTKVPAQYYVVVQLRHKYSCKSCHGDLKTAPSPPRIQPGSSYSDELMIDVAVSKYCDLIPIERQAKMAAREGLDRLPPQSLIELTHNLAEFVKDAYDKVERECLKAQVLHADETPHRMLEGDKKNSWYLWGFSTPSAAYFTCHDTRSGDVAGELLKRSSCRFLVSDVFTGYSKAVKETNKFREESHHIKHVYCNAHARRYFKQSSEKFPEESDFYIKQYRKIYRLEGLGQKNPDKLAEIRSREKKYFEKIRSRCLSEVGGYSSKSKLGKAMSYFLKNFDGLTRYLSNPELPIDNNPQERLLRSPVIGRKTWYGTHSKRGAETASILFTLVESCKLNKINPREYFRKLVEDLHQGKNPYTPSEYKDLLEKQ